MPGPMSVDYIVAAAATGNVGSTASGGANSQFNPGALPQPVIDGVGIQNGQYFLLTRQVNNQQNGIWYADAAGPVAVMTVATGLNPNVSVSVDPAPANDGAMNAGTTWVYAAVSHDGGPGFVII